MTDRQERLHDCGDCPTLRETGKACAPGRCTAGDRPPPRRRRQVPERFERPRGFEALRTPMPLAARLRLAWCVLVWPRVTELRVARTIVEWHDRQEAGDV